MKKELKDSMLEQALERIMHVREMQESFSSAYSYLSNAGRDPISAGNMREELYRRELDEWRGLFMWGLVCDEKTRDRVKAAAYERFLSDKMCVNKWLFNDENPKSWLTKDENEFRASVKELFKPSKQ